MLVIIDTNNNIKDLAAINHTEQDYRYAGYIMEREFDSSHSIKEITNTEWENHAAKERYKLACINAAKTMGAK